MQTSLQTSLQTSRKAALVQDWGFTRHESGTYYRDIYQDQGYRELWTEEQPDIIQFFKDGARTEDYGIDWSLFN